MNRRNMLKGLLSSPIVLVALPAGAVLTDAENIEFYIQEFDYGVHLGVCGIIRFEGSMVRSAVIIREYRWMPDKEKKVEQAKNQVREQLRTGKACFYGDECVEGNEVKLVV